jgi:hypothetical protein
MIKYEKIQLNDIQLNALSEIKKYLENKTGRIHNIKIEKDLISIIPISNEEEKNG